MIRTVRKTVMLSEGEFEAMEVAAAAEGLSVTVWLRTLGMRIVSNQISVVSNPTPAGRKADFPERVF